MRSRADRDGSDRRWTLALLLVAATACGRPQVGGLEVAPARVVLPASGYAELTVTLDAEAALEEAVEPVLFLHLLDADGKLVRTFDLALPEPWVAGKKQRFVRPIYQSALAAPLPAGDYRLTAGLYSPRSGQRFELRSAGPRRGRAEVEVATVTVPATAPAPSLELGAGWEATEPGSDRQVLARRRLAGEGELVVGAAAGEGVLLVELVIPSPEPGRSQLELAPGASEPQLRLEMGCNERSSMLTGSGSHRLELPIPPAGCTLRFSPEYAIVDANGVGRTALLLEVLAWRAAE